jgi:hypothetical protein
MHAIQAARRLTVAPAMSPVLCCLVLSSLMATIAAAAEQRLSPHRFVPAKGLIAYVEFDGLDAHAEAWNATSAFGLLVETPAGSVMTELAKRILQKSRRWRRRTRLSWRPSSTRSTESCQTPRRIFPSVLAAAVDDQGFRLIAREALPLACFGSKVTVKSARAWTKGKGFDQKLKLELSFFH